jgi:hypothetical protein
MTIRVSHTLDDLESDLRKIATTSRSDMRDVVRDGIRAGNLEAKTRAKRTAGSHGKHYHRAFSAEMHSGRGLFGNVISGEYGPDIAKPQGGMSFEFGSRNQKPHLDLAKSAELIGPIFAAEVRALPDRWFWPES